MTRLFAFAGMAVGKGYCFLIDGFHYIAIFGSLLAVRRARAAARPNSAGSHAEARVTQAGKA